MTATASLALLGLDESASEAEIEDAHAELTAYLELAPDALRQWADEELAAVEHAYADLLSKAPAEPASAPVEPVPNPTNGHATLKLRSRAADLDALNDAGDLLDGHVEPAPRRPERPSQMPPRAQHQRKTRALAKQPSTPTATSRLTPRVRRLALVAGAAAALLIGVFGVYMLGNSQVPGINGTPAPAATQAGADPAAVAALMQKIAANPQDLDALQGLADIYYAAGDYATASVWLDKLLAVDPANVAALLGKGAVAYNTNDFETAEQSWRAVLAIDDTNVEAHYDLGFMYFGMLPPKTEQAKAEWNRVIALVPDSEIAQTVRTHLQQLDGAQASGSPAVTAPASPTN